MKKEIKKTVNAGGIVRKKIDGKVFIVLTRDSRKHVWILPKGHLEDGETIEETALREVKEETGLDLIEIVKKLGVKERLSFIGDELKTIHYFLFDCGDVDGLNKKLHKIKDGTMILEPKWFPLDKLPRLFWKDQKEIIKDNLDIIFNL